jgi:hypothetical protein
MRNDFNDTKHLLHHRSADCQCLDSIAQRRARQRFAWTVAPSAHAKALSSRAASAILLRDSVGAMDMIMRRATMAWAAIAIVALALAGCGSSEPAERAAFVTFLQTRVIDKPGVHVPRLTDEERDRLGAYGDHYAVIAEFNKAMDDSVSPKFKAAISSGAIRSLEDVVTRRAELQSAKAGIAAMSGALDDSLARADAARAKLDQPAEVKPVYDKAYDRLVTQPAAAFKDIVPVMDTVLGEAIELGRYIEEHRSSVRLSGPLIETSDPAVRAAINAKLESLQAKQRAVQSAQARLRSVVYGG